MSDAEAAGQRMGELLGDLSQETAALVRREFDVARTQAREQIRRSAAGIALMAAAAVLSGLTLGTASAGVVRSFDRALPGRKGALAATLLYGGLATGFAAVGVRELRRHAPGASMEAAQAVGEDARTAAESASAAAQRPDSPDL